MLKKLFRWIFKDELAKLERQISITRIATSKFGEQEAKISNILNNIDVSVDVHEYSRSWAVISIQGENSDYIKFVDLGKSDIREIQKFLRNFDRSKVDANPMASKFLKISKI